MGIKIDDLTLELMRLKKKNSGLSKKVTTLEEENEWLKSEIERIKNIPPPPPPKDRGPEVDTLRKELTEATDYILELEE